MSLSIERFEEFFHALWNHSPFPWQTRLAQQVVDAKHGWPDCIDLPTASGKTAAIDIAVFALACQAEVETRNRTVGRRIFFTVNRRVIVDEAFERASDLATSLLKTENGILKEVADALRKISGDADAPPLDIAQLRGGVYRDRAWARSITQPIVVCTTADQLGSRILFRGYGVSASAAPIHAALCGCDSLILLDEAHVTRAFSQTMQLLTRYQAQYTIAPKMRFVQMTATPAGEVKRRFELNAADHAHPILKDRQKASKPASLVKLAKKTPVVGEIVSRAFDAVSDARKAIGIIVNRVQTARDIERQIQEEVAKRAKKDEAFEARVHLVIGRMRPIDRDALQDALRGLVGPERPDLFEPNDPPIFIVATQCLEVGADYDFDALITECASIDALRQRFGRLNRKGRKIDVAAAVVTNEESLKGDDPIYGDALKNTWEWLCSQGGEDEQVDFGLSNFKRLWKEVEAESDVYLKADCPKPLLSPAQDAAVLLPAHLDALCQTNPQPVPSPDVSFFIHGPQRDNADVNVCWRADLGDVPQQWPDIVRLLPPTSPECMTAPLHVVASWMRGKASRTDADVPVQLDNEESKDSGERCVLIWRSGEEAVPTRDPRDLRPGDTVVVPAHDGDSLSLGHIPARADGTRPIDIAEEAYERARRQRIIRVHPLVNPDLPQELLNYAATEEGVLSKPRIRELLGYRAEGLTCGPDEIDYPSADGQPSAGLLLRFNQLLPNKDALRPSREEDDGEGASIESSRQILLDAHTKHVVDRVRQSVDQLHLNGHASLFECSAQLHDLGKADVRFQAALAGLTPYEAIDRPLLAKSGLRGITFWERNRRRVRAQLPPGFRHEMLSLELVANGYASIHSELDRDLLLHLIAAHHGYARPFAPVVIDNAIDETRSIDLNRATISAEERGRWTPSHCLDSGVAERFWKLTRTHGWWGLAWLESILRLADQQASATEEERKINE
jgi:CRISPR-associated endonuclease/helicase Cas3